MVEGEPYDIRDAAVLRLLKKHVAWRSLEWQKKRTRCWSGYCEQHVCVVLRATPRPHELTQLTCYCGATRSVLAFSRRLPSEFWPIRPSKID